VGQGTAQSSTNETGCPPASIDIMTLRRRCGSLQSRPARPALTTSTTPAPFALVAVPVEAEIAHQFGELLQLLQVLRLVFLGKLDDSIAHRDRPSPSASITGRNIAISTPERDHGAVDKLDCNRTQLDEVLGGVHRLIEAAEMADAEYLVSDNGPEFEFDLRGEGERAFRADQKMRHVVWRHCRGVSASRL